MIVQINDPEDPRITPYLRVKERDLAGRRGEFIAEGEVVLRVLLGPASRCRARSLLIAEGRLERLAPMIEGLDTDVPVYAASQGVMDAAVGFHIHRGILAHGARPDDPGPAATLAALGPRALILALFGVSNHDNIGGIFRNAAAFGVDAVILDGACCDPLYRKAIRVSVGATLAVPFTRLSLGEDALEVLERAGFEVLALSPTAETQLSGARRSDRTALLLGAEGPGLPSEILRRSRTFGVEMAPGWDSLNVGAASAIALYELTRRTMS
ncbi:MAG TPA: RNA methyltransferase [Caulobacteraceae bacterium]